jgi:hypothetical protein
MRISRWLEGNEIFTLDLSKSFDSSWFIGIFQAVAVKVNYFIGFALVAFFFLMFGLRKWAISK